MDIATNPWAGSSELQKSGLNDNGRGNISRGFVVNVDKGDINILAEALAAVGF